jgi:hypothetical protein
MNTTQELLHKLRFTYSDNGAGYNSDFTLTLQQAADLIEELTDILNEKVTDKVQGVKHWLIRKELGTKDTYFVSEGEPPEDVLRIYNIVKEQVRLLQ